MSPFPMMAPAAGMFMPTIEQQEEYSLAFLNDQKQQIATMKEYFQECVKSLDAAHELIEQEVSKIDTAKRFLVRTHLASSRMTTLHVVPGMQSSVSSRRTRRLNWADR